MIKSSGNYNLHPLIDDTVTGNKILDYRLRTRIDNNPIPQEFNNTIAFISFNSFQQNNKKLSQRVRRYVQNTITTKQITAIGGESYFYSPSRNCNFFTNSKSILNDFTFNNFLGGKLIDYNKDALDLNCNDTVINLATLNANVIDQVNNSLSNKIVIINCHHKDFWKKQKRLTNYKLQSRKKFIDWDCHYFITVSVFVRFAFVPLGGNCAVTNYLKEVGLRNTAYSFDWCEIKMHQVIRAFAQQFRAFSDVKVVKFSKSHQNTFVVKNGYGKFAHEVMNEIDIDKFREKLQIRVSRTITIKNPVFVRLETFNYKKQVYIEYWKYLIEILDRVYGEYKIILISHINPQLEKVNWIELNNFSSDWKYENAFPKDLCEFLLH